MNLIKCPALFVLLLSVVCTTVAPTANGQNITTIVGNSTLGFSGDGGPATSAQVNGPNAIYLDATGDIYFCDGNNNVVRKISANGIITTVAGVAGAGGYSGDGGLATAALFNHPTGIVGDAAGNLYIADMLNQRVRKIDVSGIVTTIAGTGMQGYSGDGGPGILAEFDRPYGMALDSYGNLYIADQYNHVVRKLTTSGTISTFAGTGNPGYSGDGGAANVAELFFPNLVTVDFADNVFISDNQNHSIRKVNTSGVISTYAGNGSAGFSGDGGAATAAQLYFPAGMKMDLVGNLFVSDANNHRIRKITPSGIISTIAGTGAATYGGDGGLATAASLNEPNDVTVDNAGNVIIVDFANNRLRKIDYGNTRVQFANGPAGSKTVCKNSSTNDIDTVLEITDPNAGQIETWALHTAPLHGTAVVAYATASSGASILPTGLSYTPAAGYVGIDSFVVWVNDGLSVDTCTVHIDVIECNVAVGVVNKDRAALNVYPNPGNGEFVVNFISGKSEQVKLTVFDITGKTLQEYGTLSNTPTQLKLYMQPGVYFLKVSSPDDQYVRKILVK